ncbi:peptidase M23 [Alsobacter soli]|uniref:Peptidase M23 n=2 Tax=Alsobacter soli TaxID=2109933 RepID=A0A2T1HMD6_9HYPH|nr:peptidase M23 [Alsobacter soli]
MRFGDNPFQNPFQNSARFEPGSTGSVQPAPQRQAQSYGAAPAGAVTSAPLAAPAPVASAPLPPPSGPVYHQPRVAAVAPVAPAPLSPNMPASPVMKGWTAQGGSTVTLGQGETVAALSNRYGVPEQAIRSVNGLAPGARPGPGAQLIIPVYNAAGASAPAAHAAMAAAPAASAPISHAPQQASRQVGKARMQLVQGARPAAEAAPAVQARAEPVRAAAPVVAAAKPQPHQQAMAAPAHQVAARGMPKVAPAPVAQAKVAAAPAKPVVAAPAPAPVKVAAVKPVETAKPAKAVEPPPAAAPVKATAYAPAATPAPAAEPAETASIQPAGRSGGSEFRWPARGRVITGFNKQGGNDGINIALPEGTPVKAAEAGEVAYAGNELKGYGNLVLIRHPDGWVSAYAHNGELKVKRGDKISRGQVLALSGQSGNVSSPQLHFELRKGSTPVDPMPHLASN